MARNSRIAKIEEHKVKTGETLESLASKNGMSWQDLAKFNWGTSVPKEINQHLREQVGCTKKTTDGKNYKFDSSDDPGLVYIPKPWKQEGLSTDRTHTIKVRTRRNLILRLDDQDGHRIPETSYVVAFKDNSLKKGQLGKGGAALIRNPPEGPFAVTYPDHDDILAKSLAACVREGFDAHKTDEIFRLLQHPPDIIKRAISAYDQYFNDYTGKGLIEDIYKEVTDPEALTVVEGFMAYAGLATRGDVTVIQDLEQDGEEEG